MEIESINEQLRAARPDTMIMQSFDIRGRRLVLAFTCSGGPREDEAFVLEFGQAALFHLPSVLYEPVFFRMADETERERLIPRVSYDPLEVSGTLGAFTVLVLEDEHGCPYGYYVAAERARAAWKPRSECLQVW